MLLWFETFTNRAAIMLMAYGECIGHDPIRLVYIYTTKLPITMEHIDGYNSTDGRRLN